MEVPNLKTTPIKEIIFTISFKETVEKECIERFTVREEISSTYEVSKVMDEGYILRCDPACDRIIQAKRGSILFHKLNEYVSFDILLEEVLNIWEIFQDCSKKLTPNRISVRYINFIEMKGKEKASDIVTVYPQHSFEGQSQAFLNVQFPHKLNNNIIVSVTTSETEVNAQKGIILDLLLTRVINDPVSSLQDIFYEFRELKNDIFLSSVTPEALTKYL